MRVVKILKSDKTVGMDCIVVEMFQNGGISLIDWLLRMFNI